MDGESKELLREWLIRNLEPLCDADPHVLSKYVLALVQNDLKKDGLKDLCINKLEEFLGDETNGFVQRLFKALANGSYRQDGLEEGEEEQDEENWKVNESLKSLKNQTIISKKKIRHRSDLAVSDSEDDGRFWQSKRHRSEEYDGDDTYARSSHRTNYGGRYGERSRGMGSVGGLEERAYGGVAQYHGGRMWDGPPMPLHLGPNGYPLHPRQMGDFDPHIYNPDNPAILPLLPHQMNMPMGRGRGGRGHMSIPYMLHPNNHVGPRGRIHGNSTSSINGRAMKAEGQVEANTHGSGKATIAKTTLRVSNVDPKYINMTKLSLHFSKFGNVVNVQMRPNFKCAYVQYGTEEEAKKAFHSPIPVCNNRFIEVKWAKYDAKDPHGAPSLAEQLASEQTTEAFEVETEESLKEGKDEATMTSEELRLAALEKGRKILEEKRELLGKQKDLIKQKEALIKRQLAQQKEILERMSQNSANVSIADKRELLTKITSLSQELKALQPRPATAEAQLEDLRAELSAHEAQTMYGRGRGGRSGRGRGGRGGRGYPRSQRYNSFQAPMYSNRLDNRTTIIKVANLPEEARDPIVLEQHFGQFGNVEKVVLDINTPSESYIKFHDRYSGQVAFSHGRMYGETQLEMSWVEVHHAPPSLQQLQDSKSSSATEENSQDSTNRVDTNNNTSNHVSNEVSASA